MNEPEASAAEDQKGGSSAGPKPEGAKPPERGQQPLKLSRRTFIIGVVVMALVLMVAFFWWWHARQFIKTDDAYTTGHVHQVSSRVPGLVSAVKVDDNQPVKAGDVLVALDPRDLEVALSRARSTETEAEAKVGAQGAAIGQTKAGISAAEAQVERARAGVVQAAAELEKSRLDYERVAALFTKDLKAVSKAEVEAATATLETARALSDAARAQLAATTAEAEAARANVEAAEQQLTVTRAGVTSARAAVRQAELQLSYTRITAPVAGRVARKTVEEGQQIQPGQALLAVVPDDVWVIANLKENQLEKLRPGQRVDIRIDTLPHQTFFGRVQSVQPGTGGTFSLLPADNATGNFTKIVQRVPVKIIFDPESIRDFRTQIVPGLSCLPRIDLRSLESNPREGARAATEQRQNKKEEHAP